MECTGPAPRVKQRTLIPSAASRSTRCRPMKPLAPVTRTVVMRRATDVAQTLVSAASRLVSTQGAHGQFLHATALVFPRRSCVYTPGVETSLDAADTSVCATSPLLCGAAESDLGECALRGCAGVLRIDLQPDAFDVRRTPPVGCLIIGGEIARFRHPVIQLLGAGFAHHRENVHQRNRAGIRHYAFRRRAVPDVTQNAPVLKSHQDLGGLI